MIAIVGVPVIGLMMFVLERTSFRGPDPYLIVVHYTSEAEQAVQEALPRYKLRSRTVTAEGVELMGEVRMNAKDAPQVDALLKIKGVKDASLVSYTSDSA